MVIVALTVFSTENHQWNGDGAAVVRILAPHRPNDASRLATSQGVDDVAGAAMMRLSFIPLDTVSTTILRAKGYTSCGLVDVSEDQILNNGYLILLRRTSVGRSKVHERLP
jgi:hypothetical protein